MTGSSYNNGVSQSRGYNSDNTLATISFSGASIGNMIYGWDDNKNKTSETISGTMSGYGFSIPSSGYDDEDRLVEFNRTDGNLDQQWDLSLVGDWDKLTTEGTAQNRSHGDTHELQSVDSNNLSHDVKGNITLIPSNVRPNSTSLALAWDMDNRLSTADVGNDSSVDMTYKFDALGRRVLRDDGTDATVFVQVGQQTIADYASGATPANPLYCYVYASYIDEPVLRYEPSTSDSIYFHRNQQYSITALTDDTGTIVERYAYSAYGVPTITDASGMVRPSSQEDNRYLYTGREWDDVLLMYHYRARMYDAELGRFLGRDPIGFEGSEWSLFEFLEGNPFSYVDPLGYACNPPDFLKCFLDCLNKFIQRGDKIGPNHVIACLVECGFELPAIPWQNPQPPQQPPQNPVPPQQPPQNPGPPQAPQPPLTPQIPPPTGTNGDFVERACQAYCNKFATPIGRISGQHAGCLLACKQLKKVGCKKFLNVCTTSRNISARECLLMYNAMCNGGIGGGGRR